MFLSLLNPTQQSLFYELARAVTELDGALEESEQALLAAVQVECGLIDVPAVRDVTEVLADVPATFPKAPTRSVLLMELAGVALIDGDAHPAEVAVVAHVATALGVSDGRAEECFSFAERARRLLEDGLMLISTADEAS